MNLVREISVDHLTTPAVPVWVRRWLEGAPRERFDCDGLQIERTIDDALALFEVRVAGAGAMDAAKLEAAVARSYEQIGRLMRGHATPLHPWRFWNYVPGILQPGGELPHRYMAFNAGRHAALGGWYEAAQWTPRIVAASAVDAGGDELVVHMLAGPTPAEPLENPRQRAAYRYSPRYGPVAPSFARASAAVHPVTGERLLITAGTASIVGETTRHIGCLNTQLLETLANLAALWRAAEAHADHAPASGAWSQMRAYVVDPADTAAVIAAIAAVFPSLNVLEILPAQLCRPDLLVEIEALAQWNAAAACAAQGRSARCP